MKKLLMLITTLLLVSVFTLVGCSSSSYLKDNPPTSATIVGNGGTVVQKGDYLYFVNGIRTSSGLTAGQNGWGDHKLGAIYRTKVNASNAISYNSDGFLTNVDLVVPKLVGYENGKFYIFGDYIYYSTPNNNVDKDGNSLTTLTDIFRVNINGNKDSNTRLYTTNSTSLTAKDWAIYDLNGTHHLVIKDDSSLVSRKVSGKLGSTVTMATNITSTALYTTPVFDGMVSSNAIIEKSNNYIYYTRAFSPSDGISSSYGNVLARVQIGTTTEDLLSLNSNFTYTVVKHMGQTLYFTRTTQTMPSDTTSLYRSTINASGTPKLLHETLLMTTATSTTYFIVEYETLAVNNYILVNTANELRLYSNSGNSYDVIYSGTSISVIKHLSNSVVFSDDSKYYVLNNMTDLNSEPVEFTDSEKVFKTDSQLKIDFDGRMLYIHAEYTGSDETVNYYLNRLDTTESQPVARFVGKFAKTSHIPAKPANEGLTPEDEEWEIWIK